MNAAFVIYVYYAVRIDVPKLLANWRQRLMTYETHYVGTIYAYYTYFILRNKIRIVRLVARGTTARTTPEPSATCTSPSSDECRMAMCSCCQTAQSRRRLECLESAYKRLVC